MRSTINWTGRVRIPYSHVPLVIEQIDDSGNSSKLRLTGSLRLPAIDDCEIVLEAYRDSQRYREKFAFSESPIAISMTTPLFTTASAVLCDLKLVSTVESGKIRASALGIKPRVLGADPASRSLLPVDKDDTLGEVLWRLELAGDQPILLVNSRLDDWKAFVRRPDVFCLILPHVAREIAEWLARQEASEEELTPVATKWKTFFETGLKCELPSLETADDEIWGGWVNDAVQRFATSHDFATEWIRAVEDAE